MSGHSSPLHCPYCGEEDLFPHDQAHGAWECHACRRAFSVRLIGLLPPSFGTADSTGDVVGEVRG